MVIKPKPTRPPSDELAACRIDLAVKTREGRLRLGQWYGNAGLTGDDHQSLTLDLSSHFPLPLPLPQTCRKQVWPQTLETGAKGSEKASCRPAGFSEITHFKLVEEAREKLGIGKEETKGGTRPRCAVLRLSHPVGPGRPVGLSWVSRSWREPG